MAKLIIDGRINNLNELNIVRESIKLFGYHQKEMYLEITSNSVNLRVKWGKDNFSLFTYSEKDSAQEFYDSLYHLKEDADNDFDKLKHFIMDAEADVRYTLNSDVYDSFSIVSSKRGFVWELYLKVVGDVARLPVKCTASSKAQTLSLSKKSLVKYMKDRHGSYRPATVKKSKQPRLNLQEFKCRVPNLQLRVR